MTLRTTVRAAIGAVLKGSADFAEPSFQLPFHSEIILETGTGADQADIMFSDQRTLAASTSEDLDLNGGSLIGPLGQALTFVDVKAILVRAAAGNGGNIVVGGAALNAFAGPFADVSDKANIPAGGAALFVAPSAGWPVTGGTGDLLAIANSDGAAAAIYDIVIIGTSA